MTEYPVIKALREEGHHRWCDYMMAHGDRSVKCTCVQALLDAFEVQREALENARQDLDIAVTCYINYEDGQKWLADIVAAQSKVAELLSGRAANE